MLISTQARRRDWKIANRPSDYIKTLKESE